MTQTEYLQSNLGKARCATAKADRLATTLQSSLAMLATAITVGNGTEEARKRVFDAMLDLRLAVADVDAFVRLSESE